MTIKECFYHGRSVTSDVAHGMILGSNNMDTNVGGTISQFVDATKNGDVVDIR